MKKLLPFLLILMMSGTAFAKIQLRSIWSFNGASSTNTFGDPALASADGTDFEETHKNLFAISRQVDVANAYARLLLIKPINEDNLEKRCELQNRVNVSVRKALGQAQRLLRLYQSKKTGQDRGSEEVLPYVSSYVDRLKSLHRERASCLDLVEKSRDSHLRYNEKILNAYDRMAIHFENMVSERRLHSTQTQPEQCGVAVNGDQTKVIDLKAQPLHGYQQIINTVRSE